MEVRNWNDQPLVNIINGDMENTRQGVNRIMNYFIDAIKNNLVAESWESFRNIAAKMEAMSNILGIAEDQEKQKVYYYSALRTTIELNEMLYEQFKLTECNEYAGYKHIYEILRCLSQNNMMTQGRLADALGISKYALGNALRRAGEFELWTKKKAGNYTFYVITAKGKEVYKNYKIRTISESQTDLNKMMLSLIDCLSNEIDKDSPSADHVIAKMNEDSGEGISLWDSEEVKGKLKRLLTKSEKRSKRSYDSLNNMINEDDISDMIIDTSFIELNEYKDFDSKLLPLSLENLP